MSAALRAQGGAPRLATALRKIALPAVSTPRADFQTLGDAADALDALGARVAALEAMLKDALKTEGWANCRIGSEKRAAYYEVRRQIREFLKQGEYAGALGAPRE